LGQIGRLLVASSPTRSFLGCDEQEGAPVSGWRGLRHVARSGRAISAIHQLGYGHRVLGSSAGDYFATHYARLNGPQRIYTLDPLVLSLYANLLHPGFWEDTRLVIEQLGHQIVLLC
jgi:hypothetical protein